MSRAPLIVANWKMNKTSEEGAAFIKSLREELPSFNGKRIWIAPSFVALRACVEAAKNSSICIGAQNMHTQIEGAFTGEVSCAMLKAEGVHFVLLGHSERRQYCQETFREVNAKLKLALSQGLTPIVCVGESLEERERHQEKHVLETELKQCLAGVSAEDLCRVVIAYEPVWAIGTGRAATAQIAQEMHAWIRSCVSTGWGAECANKMALLYGGSVKAQQMPELMAQTDIDGVLVGGAGLEFRSFIQVIDSNC